MTGVAAIRVSIGSRSWIVGGVPDVDQLPGELVDAAVRARVQDIANALEHVARQAATERDVERILGRHRAALRMAIRTSDRWPTGPMVRVLREAAGMTRRELAAAIGRDPRSVRRWEEGRRSRFSLIEDWRAAVALGYSESAITATYLALKPVASR